MSVRTRPDRRTRGRTVSVLAAVLALLLPVACSNADEEDVVSVLLFGDPEELQAYRALVDDYEAQSEVEVELIEASDRDDLIARLSTSIAGGSRPTCSC